jgi:hypothetical protein
MSFVPNMTQKRCFAPCRPDVVQSGGCSCNNLLAHNSNKIYMHTNRIYIISKIIEILNETMDSRICSTK